MKELQAAEGVFFLAAGVMLALLEPSDRLQGAHVFGEPVDGRTQLGHGRRAGGGAGPSGGPRCFGSRVRCGLVAGAQRVFGPLAPSWIWVWGQRPGRARSPRPSPDSSWVVLWKFVPLTRFFQFPSQHPLRTSRNDKASLFFYELVYF